MIKNTCTIWLGLCIALAAVTSCTKSTSPLVGTYTKVVAPDTLYMQITDNTHVQMGQATGHGYVEMATGNYTYTNNEFTFAMQTDVGGNTYPCLGVSGLYAYTLNGIELTFVTVFDTCTYSQNGHTISRSTGFSGNWIEK